MRIPKTKVYVQAYPLQGGEDLIVPTIAAQPGTLRYSQNYECDQDGRYRAIDGYEVFDGQPKPSEASYRILNIVPSGAIAVGDTITGDTSADTGKVLVYVNDGIDCYAVLNNATGTYQDGEDLKIGGVVVGVADGLARENGASTDTLHDTYLQAAIEDRRDQIAAVPGSGNILGVWQFNGVKYAFRNNAGGTAAVMFKSSATGWTECDLGREIAFTSGGVFEVSEEDEIEGEIGGATATVKRIILTSGAWADGDAAGRLILYDQTGDFQAETIKVGANLNVATIGGNSTAHSLTAGGRFEFKNHNFYGASNYRRMYGCDGVNYAFEWDGDTFVPIVTGMTTDTPNHIEVYRQQLFLSFTGGSVQHSSPGDPYSWSAVLGAAELGVGDEVTNMCVIYGPILAIQARNSTHLLYGTGVADWELKPYADESGCIEWSGQLLGSLIYLDDRGLTTIYSSDTYGDYVSNTISKKIKPYLKQKLSNVQCSVRCRDKGQYRLFFDDMQAICLTLDGNKTIGYTRFLYDVLPVCCCSTESSTGEEELFFGSTNGYIYQMDSGTSFNGNSVHRFIKTHYNSCKYPSNKKRFRKIVIELDAPVATELDMFIDFSYGDDSEITPSEEELGITEVGGSWDAVDWDDFVWGGPSVSRGIANIEGSGDNFAVIFTSETTYAEPHTLQGIIIHYSVRGLKR